MNIKSQLKSEDERKVKKLFKVTIKRDSNMCQALFILSQHSRSKIFVYLVMIVQLQGMINKV